MVIIPCARYEMDSGDPEETVLLGVWSGYNFLEEVTQQLGLKIEDRPTL